MHTVRTKRVLGFLSDSLLILLGSLIFAASVNIFTAPNNIAPGGLTGLATILNYASNDLLPIGITIIVLNIPIFIWAFIEGGWKFVAKTMVATIVSSFAIDLTAPYMPAYRGDMMLTTVFGGVLAGFGLALILIRGATTGGTDMVATLLGRHFPHLSMGRLLLLLDLVIVVASALVYQNYESPLYATIVIFITTKVIDAALYGVNNGTGKMMFIISPRNLEIADRVMAELDRGVTELKARGCYTKQDNGVLLCAVRRQEVHRTYRIIYDLDPNAFIIVGEAGEITGEGFREIPGARESSAKRRAKKEKKAREKKAHQNIANKP